MNTSRIPVGPTLPADGQAAFAEALALIEGGAASCVALRNGAISAHVNGRGLQPLLSLYESGALCGVCIVDKIIGKAAAMLFVLGGVRMAYGCTVSKSAAQYLREHAIPVSGGRLIERIINRTGDGLCPMEQTVLDIDDPAEGLAALRQTIARLRAGAEPQQPGHGA